MNKLYNQSNEEIIACGTEGSPIRCKTLYNLTFDKLLSVLKHDFSRKIITNDSYLMNIIIQDKIPKEQQSNMLKAVNFYFKEALNKMNETNITNRENVEKCENLSKALNDFKTKYPNITSGDLQTFIIGWNECEKYLNK